MTAQSLEIFALAIGTMNGAFTPKTEAFIYKNCGKLKEPNGNLRTFSTVSGGLKSLISELSRFASDVILLAVAGRYGCNSIEKEFIILDFLSQALGTTVEATAQLSIIEVA